MIINYQSNISYNDWDWSNSAVQLNEIRKPIEGENHEVWERKHYEIMPMITP